MDVCFIFHIDGQYAVILVNYMYMFIIMSVYTELD